VETHPHGWSKSADIKARWVDDPHRRYTAFREHLLKRLTKLLLTATPSLVGRVPEVSLEIAAEVSLQELDAFWWNSFERLGPSDKASPPFFKLTGVTRSRRCRAGKQAAAEEIVLKDETRSGGRCWTASNSPSARGRSSIRSTKTPCRVPGRRGYPSAAQSEKSLNG